MIITGQRTGCRPDIEHIPNGRRLPPHGHAGRYAGLYDECRDFQLSFREDFIFREDLMHLYDELLTSGKRSS
jgi:hypothetical protein